MNESEGDHLKSLEIEKSDILQMRCVESASDDYEEFVKTIKRIHCHIGCLLANVENQVLEDQLIQLKVKQDLMLNNSKPMRNGQQHYVLAEKRDSVFNMESVMLGRLKEESDDNLDEIVKKFDGCDARYYN